MEYPQSGERIHGKRNLRSLREAYPAKLRFEIRRISGSGNLWVTEDVITHGDKPVDTVSIMEFRDDMVGRETLYFGDSFEAPAWRAQWVEPMGTNTP